MLREVWKQHYLLLRENFCQGEEKLFGIDIELLIISGGQIKWGKINSAP